VRALIAAAVLLAAAPALAGPVTLKANPVDDDGQVTLGELFDGAGAAAGVVVGSRTGPSVVFDAAQLQAVARRSGLEWANPTGLRRVVVRHSAAAPGAAPASMTAAAPTRAAPAYAARAERIISRNDIVEVSYMAAGVRLTISGRAEGNAAEGQRLAIRNLQSGRVFDAVAVAPGRAVAGPAGSLASPQFAAR